MSAEPAIPSDSRDWSARDWATFFVVTLGVLCLVLVVVLSISTLIHYAEHLYLVWFAAAMLVLAICRTHYRRVLRPSRGLRLVVALGYLAFIVGIWSHAFRT